MSECEFDMSSPALWELIKERMPDWRLGHAGYLRDDGGRLVTIFFRHLESFRAKQVYVQADHTIVDTSGEYRDDGKVLLVDGRLV